MHFDDFDAYLLHVERARPGDHLTLFDLDSIAAQAFWRGGAANSSARLHVDDDGWYQLHEMLKDESDEVVVVRRFVGPLTGSMLIDVKELWNPDDDEFAEFRRRFMWGWGEALFFSSQLFDLDSEGNQVKIVTPDSVFRVHSLVDAKRPDSGGLVPLGGSY